MTQEQNEKICSHLVKEQEKSSKLENDNLALLERMKQIAKKKVSGSMKGLEEVIAEKDVTVQKPKNEVLEEAKAIPATSTESTEQKEEVYLREIQRAYEQSKKYCEEATKLAKALVETKAELSECNELLQLKDKEIAILKEFTSKGTMDKIEQIIKEMTQEIEILRQENATLKSKSGSCPECEQLNVRIKELEEEIKVMREDRNTLLDGAKVKIEEERQDYSNLSKKLEDFQEQLHASKFDNNVIEELVKMNEELQEQVKLTKEHVAQGQSRETPEESKLMELLAEKNLESKEGEESASLRAELNRLKHENKELNELLVYQKQKTKNLEASLKQFFIQGNQLQEGMQGLKHSHDLLSAKLKAKNKELGKSEEDKATLEKALLDTKSLLDRANELSAQTQLFLDEIAESESERLELKKRVAELEDKAVSSEEAIGYFAEKLPLLTSAVTKFQDQVQALQAENKALKDGGVILELQEELERTKAERDNIRREAETSKAELSQKEQQPKPTKHKPDEQINGKSNLREVNELICNEDSCRLRFKRDRSKELRECRSREAALRKQVEQLKSLVEGYEDSNKQLMDYINNSLKTAPLNTSENQMEALRLELRMKEKELTSAKSDNEKLIFDQSTLKAQLEDKYKNNQADKEETERLQNLIAVLRKEVTQLSLIHICRCRRAI
eukprot:TRINITY_DN1872_c0_g1_i17.p1 TRINITY_DN1872_c0_g1~~TRINITY_DN1872_c0_g1_i17.p1  ORF type:complete len:676 (-),score=213.61 TRINITY_DN1872_c0_g1_i17:23-2050(-)